MQQSRYTKLVIVSKTQVRCNKQEQTAITSNNQQEKAAISKNEHYIATSNNTNSICKTKTKCSQTPKQVDTSTPYKAKKSSKGSYVLGMVTFHTVLGDVPH